MIKSAGKGIAMVGLIYIFGLLCIYQMQEGLMFWPFRVHDSHEYCFEALFEEHFFGENNELNGLYFPSNGKVSRGTVLYFHGNSKNLSYWGPYAKDFTDRNYNVFTFDYSGYGKSSGSPSQQQLYQDAQKAYSWIKQNTQDENIILYGRSLGAAVAAELAIDKPAKMLIMETPFYSMQSVFQDKAPFLYLPLKLENNFPNFEYLPQIKMPVHLIHGTNDELVNYKDTKLLAALLKPDDSFTSVPGGHHKNLNKFEIYHEFLDCLLVY